VKGDVGIIAKLEAENARKWKGFDAPYANLRCIAAAAANPDIDKGLAVEREEFLKLLSGSQSAAQRHMFFAERQAAKIDGLPKDVALRHIKKVGVIGAGTMGGGITMNFLSAGIPVTIIEMAQEALTRGVGIIRKNYEASAAKGRFTQDKVEAMMGLLTPSLSFDDLADCDLVIEAVYESMDVKKDVFGKLDGIVKQGAILASNTSYLDVNEIGAATKRPQDVLGMHFFSPANVMKLLEVVRGDKTAPDVLATAMDVGKRIGKVAVVAGVCHGFIGNRMLSQRQMPAMQLLLEGATPAQIDKVHVDFGMPMGPFQMSDLAGLDIGWHRDPTRIETIRDALCAAGRFGQKNGKGFYDYDAKRVGTPSPEALAIIEDFRAKSNLARRDISDQEIIERTLYPMVNEGAKILAEGKAQRASDIDVVWIYGYGWPVYRGGPMFWGNLEGLPKIVEALDRHGIEVAPLLREKAEKGEAF
jgi:3-hydroxyacyl-CoA dehydrogenase